MIEHTTRYIVHIFDILDAVFEMEWYASVMLYPSDRMHFFSEVQGRILGVGSNL